MDDVLRRRLAAYAPDSHCLLRHFPLQPLQDKEARDDHLDNDL